MKMKIMLAMLLVMFLFAIALPAQTSYTERALNRWVNNFGYSGYYGINQLPDIIIDSDGNINFVSIDSLEVAAIVLDDVELTASIADLNATTNFEETISVPDTSQVIIHATVNYVAVGGTADALTADFTPDLGDLITGLKVVFVADSSNTGATTIAIDGGDAKSIFETHDISELEANDIRAGMVVEIIYDGTQWQQISQSGN